MDWVQVKLLQNIYPDEIKVRVEEKSEVLIRETTHLTLTIPTDDFDFSKSLYKKVWKTKNPGTTQNRVYACTKWINIRNQNAYHDYEHSKMFFDHGKIRMGMYQLCCSICYEDKYSSEHTCFHSKN